MRKVCFLHTEIGLILIQFQHVANHPNSYVCNTFYNWGWNIIQFVVWVNPWWNFDDDDDDDNNNNSLNLSYDKTIIIYMATLIVSITDNVLKFLKILQVHKGHVLKIITEFLITLMGQYKL